MHHVTSRPQKVNHHHQQQQQQQYSLWSALASFSLSTMGCVGVVTIYTLWGRVVSPTPNPRPGGAGYPFFVCVITFDLSGMLGPTSSNPTACFVLLLYTKSVARIVCYCVTIISYLM